MCSNMKFPLQFSGELQRVLFRTSITFRNAATSTNIQSSQPKPFNEIPGPRSFPIVKGLWCFFPIVGNYSLSGVESSYLKLYKDYGGMVRMHMPGEKNTVMVFEPKLIQEVFAQEGKYPNRPGLDSLRRYRKSRPEFHPTLGLFLENGEGWKELRTSAQKHMMKTPAVRVYIPAMSKVTNDFLELVKQTRNPKTFEVDNLLETLFKWALESVGVVALNKRLGCLEPALSPDSESLKLIEAAGTTFEVIHQMEMSAGFYRFFPSKAYKRLEAAQDFFAKITYKYLQEAVKTIQTRLQNNNENHEMYLLDTFLLTEMDLKQVAGIVLDMFAAGIDTTSVAVGFTLYHLAQNQNKQERLVREIEHFLPDEHTPITEHTFENLTYLKACVRESLRLNPITIGTGRLLDKDIVLGGYSVPAGTLIGVLTIATGRLEKYFPNATSFLPERWLRSTDYPSAGDERKAAGLPRDYNPVPFAALPFGHGPRMCVGRRIAEQEIYLAIIKILQSFRLEYHHKPIETEIGAINRPNRPLQLTFHDRKY